jgi:hypothetical protein
MANLTPFYLDNESPYHSSLTITTVFFYRLFKENLKSMHAYFSEKCYHKFQDRKLHETNTAHNVTISRGRHAGSNISRKLTSME